MLTLVAGGKRSFEVVLNDLKKKIFIRIFAILYHNNNTPLFYIVGCVLFITPYVVAAVT